MGEKEGKGDQKVKKVEFEKKEGGSSGNGGGGGDKKKDDGPSTVVLKVDMHCEGCAMKIKRSVKGFEGVEGVTVDLASNKLTVVGKVDPVKLRERVETKTKKKVEIVSPAGNSAKPKDGGGDAKKPAAGGGGGAKEGGGGGGGGAKEQKKPAEDKKPKAPQSSTVVLKIRLHCEGCIQRIKKSILKIKGVEGVTVDAGKDLVTVKGTMDATTLPAVLKDKLKRSVELVPAKKDNGGGGDKKGGDEKKKDGGDGSEKKKDGGGGGDKKGGDDGGEKKKEGGGDSGQKKEGGGGDKKKEEGGGGEKAVAPPMMEVNKMEYYGTPYPYQYEMVHAPQMFSDENPNACSIM